ncbi:MAG: N-acetylmuramoyl-L-alanine amidase [Bacteroidaceae bacterium]|nr:N-acetylmuramoyl-L-alanine amidase [Bacteroidaceae bacterium]
MRRFLLILVSLIWVCQMDAARKVVWVIDAGHGGKDFGCESPMHNEKAITLDVAKEVGRLVKKNISGVRVVFTREKDKYLTLQERCDIANAKGAQLFISIHVNAAPNPFARGTESFYATNVPLKGTQAGKSELLALLLQKQYLAHGREVSRGVKKRELYVCEHTNMPSVLTEIGFITNLAEEGYITSKAGQAELAQAIYEALKEWKELTKDGTVPQRTLRNLRFTHYAPLSLVSDALEEAQAPVQEVQEVQEVQNVQEAPVQVVQEVKEPVTEVKAQEAQAPVQVVQKVLREAKRTEVRAQEVQEKKAANAAGPKPYFAIQLMNTATELKEGDYRLKGFKGVRFVPSGERFKVIYSRSENYADIKNELVQVRETFPEAFIVAFQGDQQITTAEALQMLKR